jgi:hypothetical protein
MGLGLGVVSRGALLARVNSYSVFGMKKIGGLRHGGSVGVKVLGNQ